jgi:hypothetical protein
MGENVQLFHLHLLLELLFEHFVQSISSQVRERPKEWESSFVAMNHVHPKETGFFGFSAAILCTSLIFQPT